MATVISRTVAPGIYRLASGKFRVKAAWGDRARGGQARERVFPASTNLKEMKAWRDDAVAEMRRQKLIPVRGTLDSDIPRYLKAIAKTIKYSGNRGYEIRAWSVRFGSRPRHLIKATEVQQQVDDWNHEGVAASTVRHRLSALSQMYRTLDGRTAYNPTRDIDRPSEPRPEPRNVARAKIELVLSTMERSLAANGKSRKTLARCRVLDATGMRPEQLKHVILATDVTPFLNDPSPTMIIRYAGKGGKAHIKPLNEYGIAAFKEFEKENAQGRFSNSSLYKSWMLACDKAGIERFNPYRLRHSYASELRRAGMELADIQVIMGHQSPATTQRYAAPSDEQIADFIAKLDKRTKGA